MKQVHMVAGTVLMSLCSLSGQAQQMERRGAGIGQNVHLDSRNLRTNGFGIRDSLALTNIVGTQAIEPKMIAYGHALATLSRKDQAL